MSVYLSLGKDCNGNFEHINEQVSGKGLLFCPFCHCPLIAVKGLKKAAHFRHDGETCNESLNEIPQIPAWHHFHLNYPQEVILALKKGYDPTYKSPNTFQHWNARISDIPRPYRSELIDQDNWTNSYQFTDTARVILGSMTLVRFSQWMRKALHDRIQALQYDVQKGCSHRAWFDIEAHRQQSILMATLYLFEYQFEDGGLIHKVGRTQRPTDERLRETVYDLQKATQRKVMKAKVIRQAATSGHVEQFVFHRYSSNLASIADHREYLVLDDKTAKKLKAEFTKLANNIEPFNKEERFIVTGRWQYEEKRLAAAKRGIELTKRNGGKFGRPKGSSMTTDSFLSKHSDVVSILNGGASINNTVKITGKSRSTVKRVKAKLKI